MHIRMACGVSAATARWPLLTCHVPSTPPSDATCALSNTPSQFQPSRPFSVSFLCNFGADTWTCLQQTPAAGSSPRSIRAWARWQRVSSSACDAPLGDPLLAVQVIYNCGPKVAPSVISYFLSLASNSGFAGRFPCTNGTKKFVLQICPTTAAVFASFI